MRIAVTFACWNFLFLAKNKKLQQANATAFRVYCKYKILPNFFVSLGVHVICLKLKKKYVILGLRVNFLL